MRRSPFLALPLSALTFLALVHLSACGGGEPEPAAVPAGERIESPALGLAVAALPEGLAVAVNEGRGLVLVPSDERAGSLSFEVAPPPRGGVNLVQAVNDHKASILERPGGDYRGQVELMGPLGTAYASRGRWIVDGHETEELVFFTIHPAGDRLLSLVYTYPVTGDTDERRDEMIALLGEIEGTGTPPEPAPAGEEGEAAAEGAEEPAPPEG